MAHNTDKTADPDLWRRVGKAAKLDTRLVVATRAESHPTQADIDEGYTTKWLMQGNEVADVGARAVADKVEVPASLVQRRRRVEATLK